MGVMDKMMKNATGELGKVLAVVIDTLDEMNATLKTIDSRLERIEKKRGEEDYP